MRTIGAWVVRRTDNKVSGRMIRVVHRVDAGLNACSALSRATLTHFRGNPSAVTGGRAGGCDDVNVIYEEGRRKTIFFFLVFKNECDTVTRKRKTNGRYMILYR